MKTVYIAGTSKLSFLLQDLLDPQKVDFKGYVTIEKRGKKQSDGAQFVWGGYPMITMDEYQSIPSDYLIIGEAIDFDESDPKMISLAKSLSVVGMYLGAEYYIYRKKSLRDMKDKNICGIVTGMSYAQRGINTEQMSRKWALCAYPSQDLYYDFFTLADAVKRLEGKLKYVVMEIAPYSFRYDLSLSKRVCNKVYYYYREFGEVHNASLPQEELELLERCDRVLDELCYPNWRDIIFDFISETTFQHSERMYNFNNLTKEQQQESLEVMKNVSNKPYSDTIAENKMVFDMYLKLCSRHNIKVTVFIPPFSDFFRKHFPIEYVEETRNIVHEYRGKYVFEILDLYDSPDFVEDKYYMDEAHMNIYGAAKLTEVLDGFLKNKIYD